MTEKEKQLGTWLSQIADELNITPTMLDKAVKSYGLLAKSFKKSMIQISHTSMMLTPKITWFRFAYTVIVSSPKISSWQIP